MIDMLIGEEIINEAMNSWLEKNGFETRIYGLDMDFSWEIGADLIRYSLVTIDFSDRAFMEYAYELGLIYEIDAFWLSFLHELGHAETWHLVDEEDMDVPESITNCNDYFRLPRETMATEWAVRFINEHSDLVADLSRIVRPAICKFFEMNDIEEGTLCEEKCI